MPTYGLYLSTLVHEFIGIYVRKLSNNIVFSCKYHIVWCPKYRRKVLVGDVEKRLKEIINELALELNVEIKDKKQISLLNKKLCDLDYM